MDRPYVIINCAASADGKIALPSRRQLRISSDEDIERVQILREKCDAVLVGIETVLTDNPKLTVKNKDSDQPIRVVLDTRCRVPDNSFVLDGSAKTYILVGEDVTKTIKKDNVEIIKCRTERGLIDLKFALKELKNRGINTLLVEGGGTVIWNFLKKGLFDEFYVYIAPIVIGGKDTPTIADGTGIGSEGETIRLRIEEIKFVGEGILIKYVPIA